MTLDILVRQKLSCPHHPRYNPERDGEGGIRGACSICTQLLAVFRQSKGLANVIQATADMIIKVRTEGHG